MVWVPEHAPGVGDLGVPQIASRTRTTEELFVGSIGGRVNRLTNDGSSQALPGPLWFTITVQPLERILCLATKDPHERAHSSICAGRSRSPLRAF